MISSICMWKLNVWVVWLCDVERVCFECYKVFLTGVDLDRSFPTNCCSVQSIRKARHHAAHITDNKSSVEYFVTWVWLKCSMSLVWHFISFELSLQRVQMQTSTLKIRMYIFVCYTIYFSRISLEWNCDSVNWISFARYDNERTRERKLYTTVLNLLSTTRAVSEKCVHIWRHIRFHWNHVNWHFMSFQVVFIWCAIEMAFWKHFGNKSRCYVAFCNRKYWTGIDKRKKKKWKMKIRLTASDLFDSFGFGGNRRTKFCEF